MQLTNKQKNLLELIREYVSERKENPTGYGFHKYLSSRGMEDSLKSVMQVIGSLEKKELIRRDESRKIYMVENRNYANLENIFSIPVYGLASCGEALAYADDSAENYLQISRTLFHQTDPKKMFAVKALGDSMDKAGINDGDYVIFEKYRDENYFYLEGKIVVAVINGMATIKVFKKVEKEIIGLFPYSTNNVHQPIYIHQSDSILIAGIFKRVLPVKYISI